MTGNSSQEETEIGYDPIAAFHSRRLIYQSVRDCQRLEHETLKRIAKLARQHKSELLKLLSDWLLAKDDTYLAEEIEIITHCSLADWCTLQTHAKQLNLHVTTAQSELDNATRTYRETAPMSRYGLGKISEWTADDAQKDIIKRLQATEKGKRDARDKAQSRLTSNELSRKTFGKRFLRGCLNNVGQLETTSAFGPAVREMSRKLRDDLQAEWATYMQASHSSIQLVEQGTDALHRVYGRREE